MQHSKAVFHALRQRSIHTKSLLFDRAQFVDKPRSIKKLKLKQAEMQKDDGIPVFLKRGFFDKVLYNFTLGLFFVGMFMSVKTLYKLDHIAENQS